jgi:hypothetical protein
MKRGLHHPSVAQMNLALARQQSLAEQSLRSLQSSALMELMCVHDENVPDKIRMVDKKCRLACHSKVAYITQSRKPREKLGRGLTKRSKMAADPIRRDSRWLIRSPLSDPHDSILIDNASLS